MRYPKLAHIIVIKENLSVSELLVPPGSELLVPPGIFSSSYIVRANVSELKLS